MVAPAGARYKLAPATRPSEALRRIRRAALHESVSLAGPKTTGSSGGFSLGGCLSIRTKALVVLLDSAFLSQLLEATIQPTCLETAVQR